MLGLHLNGFVRSPIRLFEWKIRLSADDFPDFCAKLGRSALFFDGAAKGNPGASGAGGIIRSADGMSVIRYAWGVGFNTSFQVEALALLQGLKQLISLGI